MVNKLWLIGPFLSNDHPLLCALIFYTVSACPLLGGLSSFGVSFIGFTLPTDYDPLVVIGYSFKLANQPCACHMTITCHLAH